jgi:hypothetical protein
LTATGGVVWWRSADHFADADEMISRAVGRWREVREVREKEHMWKMWRRRRDKEMSQPHLPWEAMKTEYVVGRRDARGGVVYPSHEDLARKYCCALATIAKRAGRDQWLDARHAYQAEQVQHEQQAHNEASAPSDQPIDIAALIDQGALNCAALGIYCIRKLFERYIQELEREASPFMQILDKSQTKRQTWLDFDALSRALLDFQAVERRSRLVALLADGKKGQDERASTRGQ